MKFLIFLNILMLLALQQCLALDDYLWAAFNSKQVNILPCLNICSEKFQADRNCTQVTIAGCILSTLHSPDRTYTTPTITSLVDDRNNTIAISWNQSECLLCSDKTNFQPAYRIESRNAGLSGAASRWYTFGLVCGSSIDITWPENITCSTTFEFKVIALGQCFERVSNYSSIALTTALRKPPSMSNVTLSKIEDQTGSGGYFDVRITWSLKWGPWSAQIDKFSLKNVEMYCPNNPGVYLPLNTKLLKPKHSLERNLITTKLQVHYSSIGCSFRYTIQAFSKCKQSSEVNFTLNLIECSLVPLIYRDKCILPPIEPKKVSYAVVSNKKSTAPSSGRHLFCVNWESGVENAMELGLEYYLGLMVPTSDPTSFYTNATCKIIECEKCVAERLYVDVKVVNKTDKKPPSDSILSGKCFAVESGYPPSEHRLSKEEMANFCPCYSEDAESPEVSLYRVLKPCETRMPALQTTKTSNTKTTRSSMFSLTDYSDEATTSPTTGNEKKPVSNDTTSPAGMEIWLPVLIITIFCVFGVGLLAIYIHRHRKQSELTEDKLRKVIKDVSSSTVIRQTSELSFRPLSFNGSSTAKPLSQTSSLCSGDVWEITSNALMFTEKLGEGAFGKVMKANFLNTNSQIGDVGDMVVAVKMVPENADPALLEDFLNEISITKKLGRHPCLLNMIACITQSQPICLVVEYAENGDLLEFLHNQKTLLLPDKQTLRELNYIDVLTFAKQIALGMDFISVRGFIHRDLACRNVLLDGKRNCKIGDFGLARYGYDNAVYFTKIGRALPIRSMPPEALYDRKFSTASDVWSYGILLYELVTLGAAPYPGMCTKDLVRELRNGYYMAKPATRNCPDNFYEIMRSCWQLQPEHRPSFSSLIKEIGKLLIVWTSTDYVDLTLAALTVYPDDPGQEIVENLISDGNEGLANFI